MNILQPCRRSFWPHFIACVLVAVTAVLLSFGALVTTFDAAMAVPDWPNTYGHNMFLYPLADWLWGPWDLFLEHGHRLLGATAGMVTLALFAAAWWWQERGIVRALCAAALVLVVVQGILGGARVLLDDRTIAKVHACTGPLFFSIAIAIATLTSRLGTIVQKTIRKVANQTSFKEPSSLPAVSSVALLSAAYLQLVAGAQLRHLDASIEPASFRWMVFLHLSGAAVVTLLAILTAASSWSRRFIPSDRLLREDTSSELALCIWSTCIVGLVIVQGMLGAGAWVVSWGVPTGFFFEWMQWNLTEATVARSPTGAAIVTAHVVIGMMILGASVVMAILAGTRAGWCRTDDRPEEAVA